MLSIEQIENKIKTPVSKDELETGILIQNKHKEHITGEGFALKRLIGYESAADFKIRQQLTDPATVQLSALILDNLNRWVTNPGTVKLVKFKQDIGGEFKKVLNQVWRGRSMEEFIRSFYKEAIYQEMSGFLVVTKPVLNGGYMIREGVEQKYEGGAVDPYIIFIAAEDVKDFNAIGDTVEYLIINMGTQDEKEVYRVIDDTNDTLIIYDKSKESVTTTEEEMTPHGLEYAPTIQMSGIAQTLKNDKIKTSPIEHVISALNRYAQKDSDLIVQMVRHMYPKLAAVTTACKMCDGRGHDYDVETKVKCKDCNGTGKVIPISRDGVIGLPQWIDEGKTPYPGTPASYITPDNDSLTTAIADLKDLAKDILYSATGDKNIIAESLNTATENLINYKGLEDRISEIVEMVESREEFLVETVARMHIEFANSFEDVSIHYGRRMILRGENEIMLEIKGAKEAGMPSSHIEALQSELIYARYKNNKTELERQQLLADLEPLNGYSVKEVADIKDFVSDDDMVLKFNYGTIIDWFEATNGLIQDYNKEMIWKKRVEKIREILMTHEILSIKRSAKEDRQAILENTDED